MPRSVRIDRPQPTWKQGFARSASESRYPNLWKGLIRAYPIGLGPTGTTIRDQSGLGIDGSLNNMNPATDWVPNDGRYCLDVDGATSSEHLLFSLPLFTGFDTYTLSLWFKQDQAAAFHAIFDDATREYSIFINTSGEVSFTGDVATGLTTATNGMTDGVWHQLILSRNASQELTSYVDGIFKETVTNGDQLNALDVHFGDNPSGGGTAFLGQYDDIFMYNRNLNANEARLLYDIGRGGIFVRKPVMNWKSVPAVAGGTILPQMMHLSS